MPMYGRLVMTPLGPVRRFAVRSRLIRGRTIGWLAGISATGLVFALAPSTAQAAPPGNAPSAGQLALMTVSNPRPELVSGGEVLVRVDVPRHINAADVEITSDGQDVTSSFQAQPDGSLLGLITGLNIGRNRLVASVHGQFASSLNVIDHSVNGPVFSGKQQLPYVCQTTSFGLGPSSPPDCFAPTMVSYVYKNTSGAFVPLTDPTTVPADAATATVNGRNVPYIVR